MQGVDKVDIGTVEFDTRKNLAKKICIQCGLEWMENSAGEYCKMIDPNNGLECMGDIIYK
jgi:hypothetical protein